jgi:hypothetical protein
VKTALSTIKQLSADEETRRLAFVRERAAWDEATLLKEAREEGVEKGIVLGALEKSRNMLTKQLMLRFGQLSEGAMQRLSKADIEQLDILAEKVLFASSLDEVFQD